MSSPGLCQPTLQALRRVVNFLCAGQTPHKVNPYLCGAKPIPAKKQKGYHRPIAIGRVLRHLTSKSVAHAVCGEAYDTLTLLQVSVGVISGCEARVHADSSVLENESIAPGHCWTLLIDFTNAFNSIDCEYMFQKVKARIPSMSPWMNSWYQSQPLLHFGDRTNLSCPGVLQSDPHGPVGFALSLQPILKRIRDDVPGLLINACVIPGRWDSMWLSR